MPTELLVDRDGKEVDWIIGYGPPADAFLEKVKKAVAGIDTYGALGVRYAKEPDNIEVVFKLAKKMSARYSDELTKRSTELYRKVLTMDPGGRTASYYDEYRKATVPYVEAAEFALAQQAASGRKPDPAPLRAFITKHPSSALVKSAYGSLSYYYGDQAKKEDAAAFFDEALARFPDDNDMAGSYLARIVRDKEPVDKGLALAEKLKEKQGYPRDPEVQENLAQLYMLKDEGGRAEEEYGKAYADSYASTFVFALTAYANFWIDQGKNLESAEEMADIAAATISARKNAPFYFLSEVASLYSKLNKGEKALALYGPDQVKKNWDDRNALYSYASFWNGREKNLESAIEAAKRSVEIKAEYPISYMLGQLLFKVKDYPEALKAAEKAVELAKIAAVKREWVQVTQFESLVKQIKEAMGKK